MKRSKQCLSVILALALICALFTGCGDKKTDDDQSGTSTGSEYVYVPEYITIDHEFENALWNTIYANGYFLSTTWEVIEDRTPEGVVPDYEGQYSVYGYNIYKIGLDGSCEKLNYTPEEIPEGVQGSSYISGMQAAKDGSLYIIEEVYTYWSDAPEGMDESSDEYWEYFQNEEHYNLKVMSADGEVVSSTSLDNLAEDSDYFYVESFAVDDDGNVYLSCDGTLYVLDKAGALQFTLESENWMENILVLGDGRIGCFNYSDGYKLSIVDLDARTFGESISLPSNVSNLSVGGGDYDFYYTNGSSFYGYSTDTQQSERVLNWINCDVDTNNSGNAVVLEDGRIALMTYNWNSDYTKCTNELVILTKTPAASVAQKTVITLATQYLNWNIRSQIIEFNRSSDKYRIEVRDYSEYNTDDDYEAGITKLKTEILAGNMPDILDLNGLPLEQLSSKGLLEDLYPYLDSDPDLSRDDIMPSVLKALEDDGKLYTTNSGFYINTVIGSSAVVGDEPGWTVDEFNAALATMPEGCTAFDKYTTRDDILSSCLALDGDSFVDWNTGECSFDSPAFVKLLEFAKSFPSDFDWDNYEWSEEDSSTRRIATGQQMLMNANITDFTDFQMYKAVFGGDITYIGFPTEYGTGNMLQTDTGYAMSSKCADKDAAWQFIRQFFTEDYQTQYSYSFPSNVKAFNAKLEKAMTPEYQKDENGNYLLDEDGNKIEISQGGWGWDDVEVQIYAITQEEADSIMELINTTTKSNKADDSILEIVQEQAAAYFDGQKSAEEAAKLVQSKANIYVNEQR